MKKVVVLALAVVLCFCSVACTDKSKKGELSHEYLGYQWENANAPIVKEKNLINFDILAQKNAMTPAYNELKVFKDLYDSTNVNINWQNITESAYKERKTLILADKPNWPDAIYHAAFSNTEIVRYSTRKVILPISDYLDKMPNLTRILKDRPDVERALTAPDGKIYSLPRVDEMGLTANENLLFMNKNWLKKLVDDKQIDFLTQADIANGLQLNISQMEQILKKFKELDMNGNSKQDDEIPLSFVYNNWQGNQTDLYGAFGLPENVDHLTIIDDKVVCTATDDRFKAATNYYAEWVNKGLISKSSFESSQDAFLSSGKGVEKLGAFYWWEEATVVSNPQNYILLKPLKGLNGEQVLGVSNYPEISTGQFVVMSTCNNPEVLLTYMDRFLDPVTSAQINYGPIGVVYEEERDSSGKLVQKPIPPGMTADELRLQTAPMGVMFLTAPEWENVVNMEPRAKTRLERLKIYANPYNPSNVKKLPTLSFNLEEINLLAQYLTNMQDYIYGNQTKWLLNGGVSDADYNTFKNTLKNQIKSDEVLKVYQAAYDRYKDGI